MTMTLNTPTTNAAVLEAARLRTRASAFASSQRWAAVSAAMLVPALVCLPLWLTVVDVIVLVASVVAWVQYRTVSPTTLSKRQLQLLGLHDHTVQATASSSTTSEKPATATVGTATSLLRPRIAISPVAPSPLPFSRHARPSPAAAVPGTSPHLDRRNFALGPATQRGYAEAAWRGISEAAETQAGASGSGGDTLPTTPGTAAGTAGTAAAAAAGSQGAYTGLFGAPSSSSSSLSPFSSASDRERPARVLHTYNTSPPPAPGSGASLAHLLSPSLPYHPTRTVATAKALAALGLREIADTWVDRLRLVLGRHLRKALHRFDAAVARAVAAVKTDPAADALRALLELRAERVGAHGVADAVAYVRQLGQPRLADEYNALEAALLLPGRRGLLSPTSSSSSGGGGSGVAALQGALARARELDRRANGQYLRVEWGSATTTTHLPPHGSPAHIVAFGSPGISTAAAAAAAAAAAPDKHAPADADLVVALFFHLCDDMAGKTGPAAPGDAPSETLYAPDVATALVAASRGGGSGSGGGRGGAGGSVVGIVRQEMPATVAGARPQYNVYSADRSVLDVLEVDEGRQNCFEAPVVFLLQSLRAAVHAAGPPTSTALSPGGHGATGPPQSPWKQQQQLLRQRRPPAYASSLDPHRASYPRLPYADDGRWDAHDGSHIDGSSSDGEMGSSERAPALSAVVRELALEVFQAGDVDSLLQYLASLGMDV